MPEDLRLDARLRKISHDDIKCPGKVSEHVAAADIKCHLIQLGVFMRSGDGPMIDIGGGDLRAKLRGENCQDAGAGADIGGTLACVDPDVTG